MLADVTLDAIKFAASKAQLEVNVGEVRDISTHIPDSGNEPSELLARIFAHVAHRLPIVKRFEKRMEGKELKAGIASDSFAFIAQFVSRNKHLIPELINYIEAAKGKVDAKRAETAQPSEVIVAPPGFFSDSQPEVTPNAS